MNYVSLRKGLLILYLLLSVLLIFDVFIWYHHNVSFRGYWTDRIVFWLWVVDSCLLICTQWKQPIIARDTLSTMAVMAVFSIAPMMFPAILLSCKLIDTDSATTQRLVPDQRLDDVRQKPLREAKVLVIEHQGLLEKEI